MLTGHERLHILRAISPEARPDFANIYLEPGGCADSIWAVGDLGVMSMRLSLDDQPVGRPSLRLNDGRRVRLDDLGMTDALTARVQAIWPALLEEMKFAADAEERALLEDDGDDEFRPLDKGAGMEDAADRDALVELGVRCRRIMLDLVLQPTWAPDEIRMYINSGAGVGQCYAAALELGLVSLHEGADPEAFRFPDLIAPDVVRRIIRDAEKATWPIELPLTAHQRIRLGAELRRLQPAA